MLLVRIVAWAKTVTGARTWQVEAVFVALALSAVALASGKGRPIEWVGTLAVFFTWMHASVADRLAEGPAAERSGVECYRLAGTYFAAKEALWCGYFAWLGAWSALAGCALFLAYPVWRRAWRAAQERAA